MEVEKTFRPGSDGTKRFIERFGNRLVCVRHRLDRQQGLRYTTVELIVERRNCTSQPEPHHNGKAQSPPTPLPIRIHYQEQILRQQVRQAGGRWDPQRRVWLLRPDAVDRLNLRDRLV